MPELCRFEGLIITMYFNEHNPPHFHIDYKGKEAQFDIVQGVITKGFLPSREARLILAWYELHKAELLEMWESKEFKKIKPLV